jgi:glycosyltransferase involved in cell wall biosynthesis
MARAFAQIGLDVELLVQSSYSEQLLLPVRAQLGRVLEGDRALPTLIGKNTHNTDPQNGSFRIQRLNTSWRSRRDAWGFFQSTEHSYPDFIRAAVAFCERTPPDIVFTRSFEAAVATVNAGIATAIETHGNPTLSPSRLANVKRLVELQNNPAFKGIVTISPVLQREFVNVGMSLERVLVWPDAVDLEPFIKAQSEMPPSRPAGTPLRVGYCGQLYEWKGVGILIETARQCPQMSFTIIGGNPEDVLTWKNKAQDLTNVCFRGYIPNQEVPLALQEFDVLCLPNLSSCEDREWMSPLKLYEYMGAARAIVASDLPAIRQVISHGENGILCAPDSSKSLSEALNLLEQDEKLRHSLSHNAWTFVQRYTWQNRARAILDWVNGI